MARARSNKKIRTKAGTLLSVAYETYKRGEEDIAKDIFVLAMEEPDVGQAMDDVGAQGPSEDELKAQMEEALKNNDMEAMDECLQQLKAMKAQQQDDDAKAQDDDAEAQDDDAEAQDDDDAEAQDDEVLPEAQVASLTRLAAKIKAGGHPDLAEKVTTALFNHLSRK